MTTSTVNDIFFDESTNEAIREGLPPAVITFFEYVTHLGDGAVLIVFATLLYWFGAESRREQRALVIAIGLGALAISAGMKGIFLRPRPELAGDYGGYSFPSAHAMGAAAFYAALAAVADTGTRLQRYVVAAMIITVIAVSRVVIGVHFVGDVVVGVGIGLLFVGLVVYGETATPAAIFATAGAIAIVAFALGSREFTTLTIGAALGAAVAWQYVKSRSAKPRGAAILLLAYLCLPVILALRAVSAFWPNHALLAGIEIVGYAAVTAAVLVVPIVAEQMNDWPPVEWLQTRLPFSGRTIDQQQILATADDE
ncbi:phosphatase PAP2 family protein [Natronorubrum sp. JWXQ-INN-674]|uniref:Phosphatase PAP2 family protein n=1 Tax=Natronorubrum halalkaliphilum TaxID=2691917 RepID=A0A6B0VQ22_9EURY|nr:phosphatase PAP2 family protein [Natronorubrum halalkaliphilum]MXV63263.1 phosphatase PAP2 family protein [Natronorubrum halalkaliphilum]